jgi:exodeoxyribonuclease III
MKIASFNINGIKARLPRLIEWLEETAPDVACLQEVKSQDEGFPAAEFEKLGYGAIWHGQKSFNGVAILAKGAAPIETQRGLPGDPEDEQSRYLEADVNGVRVASIYLPNGNPQPGPKFDYKLAWMKRLRSRSAALKALEIPVALVGDYNVIPHNHDIWSLYAKRWLDRRTRQPLSGGRHLDLLGLSGRRMAARPRISHRPHAVKPDGRRPVGQLRR